MRTTIDIWNTSAGAIAASPADFAACIVTLLRQGDSDPALLAELRDRFGVGVHPLEKLPSIEFNP